MATSAVALAPPVPPASRQTGSLVRDCLLRLGRAVQQASIYPPGHPALARGLAGFTEALEDLGSLGTVSIAVGRTRLQVAVGDGPPSAHDAPWLASRLFDRQVSAVTFAESIDTAASAAFVEWLTSTPGDPAVPQIPGVTIARLDVSRLTFVDGSRLAAGTPRADDAWRLLTAPLRADAHLPADFDPSALADHLRQAIHAAEGTGGSAIADRLIALHQDSARLDPATGADVTRRLAALVDHLVSELSSSLLTVRPMDSARKLETLKAILPYASSRVLQQIVTNLSLEAQPVTGTFTHFLRKLAQVTDIDPAAGDLLGQRLLGADLPPELVAGLYASGDDDEDLTPAEASEAAEAPEAFTPETYQAQLEALAAGAADGCGHCLVDPATLTPAVLDPHATRIAIVLARRTTDGDELASCLEALATMRGRAIERQDVTTLSEIADVIVHLRGTSTPGHAAVDGLLAEAAAAFAAPAAMRVALEALTATSTSGDRAAAMMLVAGGAEAARRAVDAIVTIPVESARRRVAAALTAFEAAVLEQTLAPRLADHRALAEACAGALTLVEEAQGFDLAMLLVGHHHREVRREAMRWLVGATLSTAKWRRVLQRAIDGEQADTIAAAIEGARLRPPSQSRESLVAFVRRRTPPAGDPLRVQALSVLAGFGESAHADLAALFDERHWAFQRSDLWLAAALRRQLTGVTADPVATAVRRWRWSPAGLWAAFMPPVGVPR